MKSLYKRIILAIILTVLAVSWFPSYYNAVAEYDEEYGEIWPVYCACQPDSEINVRAFPKYSAEIVGRVWPGDQVYTDGKKRGVWMHVIGVPCEAGEGWIHKGYLSDSPVHRVDTEYTVTRNKTFVRKYMGGKVTKKLKKGQTVTVFFLTGDVAVTNLGYIVADYLEVAEKQKYIEWEMENIPGIYSKPKSDQFIDRATLTHVISNVNCPEGVTRDAFYAVIGAVAETLEVFPYFKMEEKTDAEV